MMQMLQRLASAQGSALAQFCCSRGWVDDNDDDDDDHSLLQSPLIACSPWLCIVCCVDFVLHGLVYALSSSKTHHFVLSLKSNHYIYRMNNM